MKKLKRTPVLLYLLALIIISACSPEREVPAYLADLDEAFRADPRGTNLEWFQKAKYGMFIHYGLYSL
ncbi:MAG: hypothetical protein DRI98_10560, partial [Bacteroidetes bacterium]